MEGFLAALAISFGVIFVAELGDKSQLMAMTFATRYRAAHRARRHHRRHRRRAPGLGGGRLRPGRGPADRRGSASPPAWRSWPSRAWTLRGDKLTEEEKAKAQRARPLGAVGGRRRVLPRRTRRQDDAGHDHPGHPARLVRRLDRLDGRHGGRGRPGHRGRPHARQAPAGANAIKCGAAALFVIFGVWLIAESLVEIA